MNLTSSKLSESIVETYLDQHTNFTREYFSGKFGSHPLSHAVLDSSGVMISPTSTVKNPSKHRQVLKPARGSVSLMNPEKVRGIFDPQMASETDSSAIVTPSRADIRGLDERELLMELIREISNELDVQRLSHKILVNIGTLTNADRCSLFLAEGSKDHRILVSKLFDVTSESTLESVIRENNNRVYTVPFGVGIAGYAAQTGETINIRNAYEDPRFNAAIDKETGYKTHSIVCIPIKNREGQVIGVAQVINKKCEDHEFTEKDVEVVKNYLTFCGIGITNAQLFELSVMEYRRNQVLLQLAKRIFEEQTSLDKVVHNIMSESQELLNSKASESMKDTLVSNSSPKFSACEDIRSTTVRHVPCEQEIVFSKSFDLLPEEEKEASSPSDCHWSLNNGIAAFAAMTGETINISDAYEDDRFSEKVKESDAMSGLRTKSILCTPIKRNQQTIGVFQLINKTNGHSFDENDESLFEAFTIFCGIGIHNTNMYEKTSKLLAKQMVAMEVLSYHARAAPEDVNRLMDSPCPDSSHFKLHDFAFSDFELNDDETIQAALRMFSDLDILNLFHISLKTFVSWLLSVKKNYRPVIYHNWRHAFNVAQTMFALLTTGTMRKYFTDLESFALLVACLCHDLDHRGTNNTFQSKIESPLAQLYGTSTMEHHHFDHCIMILNSEGNNIFSELPPDDYRKVIEYLEHAILSTDLQIYFKKRNKFSEIIEADEPPEWKINSQNRTILRAMMMTACDVSAITKPWPIQQTVAKLVASEFFEQGDIERDKLKSEPMPMMDRKKKDDLPKMQVGFIDAICLPIYKLMTDVEPNLSPLLDGVTSNRQNWQALANDVNNNVEDSMNNGHCNVSNSQHGSPDNKKHEKGSEERLNEQLSHDSNNSNIKETNVVSKTKSPSPRNSNVLLGVNPSNGSKTSLNGSKKNKTSKNSSKTCCLL